MSDYSDYNSQSSYASTDNRDTYSGNVSVSLAHHPFSLVGQANAYQYKAPERTADEMDSPTLGGGDTAGYNPGTSTGRYAEDNTRECGDVHDAQDLDTPTRSSRPVAGDSSYSSPDSDSFATSDDDGRPIDTMSSGVSATDSTPYTGGTEYGSGMTGGPGLGNKTSNDESEVDSSATRFGSHGDTSSYSGGTAYGSGTTGGAGAGNKTSSSMEHDSTMGKLVEMSGKIVHNYGMVEKGHARREAAGAFDESS
ncbi:hypothetical protein D0864_02444 [Hortaea werneckii]|uniref:Uncharacterized protein n=1 Tax=Hortaea werneckii TaxID=91943 RepID=A0A3M7GX69_HORWE|nr:hypothetical protein KC338_g7033 [Hortaea werneckii]KAI7346584.1 hypothetical protein KC320_g7782 [Hortaea werneckii]RMZ05609.1 hypothetical protein D0864_02444 [Hortaea werneckii]